MKALLRQGLSPDGLALSLAIGLAVGTFPVIGATTLLELVVGVILRLNQPALQLANWLAYPLQLVLILPLVRLGEWVAGAAPATFTVSEVVGRVAAEPASALVAFGAVGLHGILGWVTLLPFVVLAVFLVLRPVLGAASGRLWIPTRTPAPGDRSRL